MRLSNGTGTILVAATLGGLFFTVVATHGCGDIPGPQPVVGAVTAKYDWPQFGGDARHASNNTLEQQLTQQNVAGLKQRFKVTLPATVQSAPAVLSNVSTASGVRDLIFVDTKNGDTVALDASTGETIWSHGSTGTAPAVSTPAVDPARAFVYSYGIDGKVHKYAVGTGVETTGGGWPQVTTLKPNVEKGGSALTIATVGSSTFLYVGNGGYIGDGGDYQGHITTINLGTGAQKVFNMMCSDQTVHFTSGSPDCGGRQSAVWAKAGVVYDSDTGKIYAATGNGTFNPGSRFWGDSIVALNPDGSGIGGGPVDSYTPSNFQSLQNSDLDLGSTQPVILPGSGTKFPHIAVQSGKDAKLRIVNLDNLSGQGGPGHVAGELFSMNLPQGGEVQNAVASWVNPADNSTWVFVVAPSNGIAGLRMSIDASGNPSLVSKWTAGGGGGAAVVANNVLFYGKGSTLLALNPATGAQLFSAGIGAVRFQSPIVANGIVYICDNSNNLTAFSLPGGGTDGGAGGSGTGGNGGGTGGSDGGVTISTRLNCGGPAAAPYAADRDFSGGTTINHANSINTSAVPSPAPVAVYQSARIGNFGYSIPGLAAGTSHTIRLHFAETFFSTAGSRVFNVSINGTPVLTNFDIFAAAGGNNRAIVRSFTATASAAGAIAIQCTSVVNNSLLSGIEIQ